MSPASQELRRPVCRFVSLGRAKLFRTPLHRAQMREDRHGSWAKYARRDCRSSFAIATRALAVGHGDPAIPLTNHATVAIPFLDWKSQRLVRRVARRPSRHWLLLLHAARSEF